MEIEFIEMDLFVDIIIKWSGKEYTISNLLPTHTFSDLKNEIYKQTNVKPERQKILGLKTNTNQNANDSTLLNDLKYISILFSINLPSY